MNLVWTDLEVNGPDRDYRLLQHPTIVPLVTVLTVLSIESIEQSEMWQKTGKWWVFLSVPSTLILIIALVLEIDTMLKNTNRTLRLFLQWAERDIGEEQELRNRHQYMEVPGSHGR